MCCEALQVNSYKDQLFQFIFEAIGTISYQKLMNMASLEVPSLLLYKAKYLSD
jgi:hypothetical protein